MEVAFQIEPPSDKRSEPVKKKFGFAWWMEPHRAISFPQRNFCWQYDQVNILDILDTMVASDVETSVAANGVRENVLACTGGAFDHFVTVGVIVLNSYRPHKNQPQQSASLSGDKRKKRQVNFEENCQFNIDKGHTYRGTTDTTDSGRYRFFLAPQAVLL